MGKVRRIAPLRHSVVTYVHIIRDLEWLKWLLISHTATNIWKRYSRFITNLGSSHSGALDILAQMDARYADSDVGLAWRNSFARYLDGVQLQDTYLRAGSGGVSKHVRVARIAKLVKRARELTLGTNDISWFLDGLSEELSKRLDDKTLYVDVFLAMTHVQETDKDFEVIGCKVRQKPALELVEI